MNNEENTKFNDAINKELNYLGVEKIEESYNGEVFKVRLNMETMDGKQFSMTLKKPKTTKTKYVLGIPVESVTTASVEEFANNERFKELEALKNKLGKCKVIANYTVMEKDNDGEVVKYRFLRSIYGLKPVEEQSNAVEEINMTNEEY